MKRSSHRQRFKNYHHIFNTSPDAQFILKKGRIDDCNQAALDLFAITSRQDFTGKTPSELSPEYQPDGQKSSRKAFDMVNQALEQGSHRFEWLHEDINGNPKMIEVLLTTISRKDEILFTTLRDISSYHEARENIRTNEERFRFIVESTNDFVWEVDREGQYTYVSPQVKDILGYTPDELIGKSPFDLMPQEEVGRILPLFQRAVEKEQKLINLENHNLSKEGKHVVLETSGAPFYNREHILAGYRGIDRDISSRKVYEDQLILTENIFNNTVEGIVITDPDGTIEQINTSFTRITGYSEEEALGQNPRLLKSDRHPDSFYRDMWNSLLSQGTWNGEIWNRRKDGTAYPEWLSISAIYDSTGNIKNFISVFHDISDQKNSEEKLEFLAFHDPLTKLPNRNLFYDRLSVALEHSKRNESLFAHLYMDVDNFKDINDTFGHPFGDELLCAIKDRVSTLMRKSDTFSRYGGDEFAILLNNLNSEKDVLDFSGRILELFQEPLLIQGEKIFTSLSIGMAIYPLDGEDIVTLEKNADMALYQAKKEGKHKAVLYHERLNSELMRRNFLIQGLRNSIESFDGFELVFQPKIDLRIGDLVGVETLIRWKYLGKSVSPDEFIPLAESSNLIIPLGNHILRNALRIIKGITDRTGKELRLSVNLSSKQFNDERLFETIDRFLQDTEFSKKQLLFEITETTSITNVEKAQKIMDQFRDNQISMSLDDFGTGYSSLSYLKKFPLEELKIDRSFVQGLPEDSNDNAICKTIISMARTLNFKVVAEGVENRDQIGFLRENNCQIIQGYYFYKPLTASELEELLTSDYREDLRKKLC
ncbi:MAG: EAL domain-containing protein [Spirochaetales bacterium]|nr:EAL domain-containing protein [Spirochaetales bacterium]